MRPALAALVALTAILFPSSSARAAEVATPYLDQLRDRIDPGESPWGYSEQLRDQLLSREPEDSSSYIDRIRDHLPPEEGSSHDYSARLSNQLGPETGTTSAIDDVMAGKSDLEFKRPGRIRHALGIRVAYVTDYDVTADSGEASRSFDGVYGGGWSPNIHFTYEFQPLHDEDTVSLGLVGMTGIFHYKGNGSYRIRPLKPGTGGQTYDSPGVEYEFLAVPINAGGLARLNAINYVRPHAYAAPGVMYYRELKLDTKDTFSGYAKTVFYGAGVAILLDWLSRDSAWALYRDDGVKHLYLTIDYYRMTAFASKVRPDFFGFSAGATFEF